MFEPDGVKVDTWGIYPAIIIWTMLMSKLISDLRPLFRSLQFIAYRSVEQELSIHIQDYRCTRNA